MPDENKPSDDKTNQDKNKTLSDEEIAKIAEETKKVIAKSDDSADDDKTPPSGDDDKDSIIQKLRDENAKRRIAKREMSEKLDRVEKQNQENAKKLADALEKVKDFEEKTEKQKAKERTELENAQKALQDTQAELEKLRLDNQDLHNKLNERDIDFRKSDRANSIEKLVEQAGHVFSSSYEKQGLVDSLSQVDENGDFVLGIEKVVVEVQEFITKSKKANSPETPGPGPVNKTAPTELGKQIETLLKKKTLTKEDKEQLDTLIVKAQEQEAAALSAGAQ
jgi:hypothetical protein